MKSVVRTQGQGKVKDVGLRGLATLPVPESVDSTVALIQALIPLGLNAVAEALEAEVTTTPPPWQANGTVAPAAAQGSSAGASNGGRSPSRISSSPSPTGASATEPGTQRSR